MTPSRRSALAIVAAVLLGLFPEAGTEAQPAYLVKDINAARYAGGSSGELRNFKTVGAMAFFSALDEYGQDAVWRSDGTPGGTVALFRVPRSYRGQIIQSIEPVGDRVYFVANASAAGRELWVTDASPAGAHLLADLTPGPFSTTFGEIAGANGELYFTITDWDTSRRGLWRTQGPDSAPIQLRVSSLLPSKLAEAGGMVYFADSDSQTGSELWVTDGSVAGTRLVADLVPGPASSSPQIIRRAGGKIFVVTGDSSWWDLWSFPIGTSTPEKLKGVRHLSSSLPGPSLGLSGTFLLAAPDEDGRRRLFASDGTTAGTEAITPPIQWRVTAMVQVRSVALVETDDDILVTDGTPEGTAFYPPGSDVRGMTSCGETAFVVRSDGTISQTEGTPSDERTVLPLNAAPYSSSIRGADSVLYVSSQNPPMLFAYSPSNSQFVLLRAFNAAGTVDSEPLGVVAHANRLLYSDAYGLHAAGPEPGDTPQLLSVRDLYYLGTAGPSRIPCFGSAYGNVLNLYLSNGTPEGTVPFLSVPLTGFHAQSRPLSGASAGDQLFFSTNGDWSPTTLWRTDGTAAGTIALRQFMTSATLTFAGAESQLFFMARSSTENGLWRSDGTAGGTFRFFEFDSSLNPSDVSIAVLGNKLTFVLRRSLPSGSYQVELWSSDGTQDGTRLISSFSPSPYYIPGPGLVPGPGGVFFIAWTPSGYRLFRTDGTSSGTTEVIPDYDLASSSLQAVLTLGGKLLLLSGGRVLASDGTAAGTIQIGLYGSPGGRNTPVVAEFQNGIVYPGYSSGEYELFFTDGTVAGTRLLQDIAPDGESSNPEWFVRIGTRVYFLAKTREFGREPWVLPEGCSGGAPAPIPTIETAAGSTLGCGDLGSITLTVNGPYARFLWSNGEVGNQVTLAAEPARIVSVTGIDASGCAGGTAYHYIRVRNTPSAVLPNTSRSVCAGGSTEIRAYLTGTPPWQVLWSDGVKQDASLSPAVRDVSPAVTTRYSVADVRDAHCFGTGSGSIEVQVAAPAEITAPSLACAHQTGLVASAPPRLYSATYSWSIENGTIVGSASEPTVTFNTLGPGTLTLRLVLVHGGCSTQVERSVEVGLIPGVPAPVAPASGVTGVTEPLLSWEDPAAGEFDVLFDTVNPPRARAAIGLRAKKFAPAGWLPGQTYFWRVAKPTPCGPVYSEVRQLTTSSCPWTGATPALVSPADGTSGQNPSTTFAWTPVTGTGHYDLYLGSSLAGLRRYRSVPPDTTSLPVSLSAQSGYFWKVVAVPSCGSAAAVSSPVASLRTGSSQPALAFVSPPLFQRDSGTRLAVLGSGFDSADSLHGEAEDGLLQGVLQGTADANRRDLWIPANQSQRAGFYDFWLESGGLERARIPMALTVQAFEDVPASSFAFLSTSRAVEKGFVEWPVSYPGSRFEPGTVVSRRDAASALASTYKYLVDGTTELEDATCTPAGSSGSTDFIDVSCWDPAWLAIHWLKTWGVTQGAGCPEGPCFKPYDPMDRSQMITFLLRLKFGPSLSGFLDSLGTVDPGCAAAWPSCSGWTDPGLQVETWPRREANLGFQTRLTAGCAGTAGNGLTFCASAPVTRDQLAEFLARLSGLVPAP